MSWVDGGFSKCIPTLGPLFWEFPIYLDSGVVGSMVKTLCAQDDVDGGQLQNVEGFRVSGFRV